MERKVKKVHEVICEGQHIWLVTMGWLHRPGLFDSREAAVLSHRLTDSQIANLQKEANWSPIWAERIITLPMVERVIYAEA